MFVGRKSGRYRSGPRVHNVKGTVNRTLVQVGELAPLGNLILASARRPRPSPPAPRAATDPLRPSRIGKGPQLTPAAGAVGGQPDKGSHEAGEVGDAYPYCGSVLSLLRALFCSDGSGERFFDGGISCIGKNEKCSGTDF